MIRGDGQQYRQVGFGAFGPLTVLRNCKRYYPRGMKTALSRSVREDGQVKTDDARPGDCPIRLVPCYTCSCKEPRGRHIWPGLTLRLRARRGGGAWEGGQRVETKGDLSEQTKQRLAGYRQAKRGERARHTGFCSSPVSASKMTPHREVAGFYFSVYTMWPASVYGGSGYR